MTKKSFIPKTLRPDVPGTIFHDYEIVGLLNKIRINDILDNRYRRSLIAKILSSNFCEFDDVCISYRKALEVMFPSIEKKLNLKEK